MFSRILFAKIILYVSFFALNGALFAIDDNEREKQDKHYRQWVRPIIRQHCGSCHNEADKKAGLNLLKYDFTIQIERDGELWAEILELVEDGQMPPQNQPRLREAEMDTLFKYIEKYLSSALAEPDPGQVILRRLSHREYQHTLEDLLGVSIPVKRYFPADGSGGGGFDNQAKVLYVSPLLLEQYYEVAQMALDSVFQEQDLWGQLIQTPFTPGIWDKMIYWWEQMTKGSSNRLVAKAKEAAAPSIRSFASLAYRRFLSRDEEEKLLTFFEEVYETDPLSARHFDKSLRETFASILISHSFLYRREVELPLDKPYQISDFELASRLSYFLWSSMPDDTLLRVAYKEDLHDPDILQSQIRRMLKDPKSMRFAESFASQWLELNELEGLHTVDRNRYPQYDDVLKRAMIAEASYFFHHVITKRQNFLDLIDSDYTFVNEKLASLYRIEGIKGSQMQRVALTDPNRGGVLGMAGVLTTTSFPLRTSPVLRGKWVLEQLLGTPPPPPPPDVPELDAEKAVETELDLRELLMLHRSPSTCYACHQKMDPIGLGLENFDAIGRWRETYGTVPIDASGVLTTGETFVGPRQLKHILMDKKEDFAENLSRRMLSYALGREVRFQDHLVINELTTYLLENEFDTIGFIERVVMSFPFRYKKSDLPEV